MLIFYGFPSGFLLSPKLIIIPFFALLFQSDCRILLQKHSGENLVLHAIMDEFEENRAAGNLTTELLNKEKVIRIFLIHTCI